jgi:tetratricopeptide (TPR) repeat protein
LDVEPSRVPALRLLGELLLENKLVTRGAEEMGRRLKAIPQGAPEAQGEAHLWLGLMTGSQSGSQAGGRHLRQAHKLLGDRPDVLLALGDYTLEHGDGGHAVELYQRASDHPEAPSEAHLALGKLAQIRREKDLARLGFERYLRSSPEGNTAQWVRRQMELLAR